MLQNKEASLVCLSLNIDKSKATWRFIERIRFQHTRRHTFINHSLMPKHKYTECVTVHINCSRTIQTLAFHQKPPIHHLLGLSIVYMIFFRRKLYAALHMNAIYAYIRCWRYPRQGSEPELLPLTWSSTEH